MPGCHGRIVAQRRAARGDGGRPKNRLGWTERHLPSVTARWTWSIGDRATTCAAEGRRTPRVIELSVADLRRLPADPEQGLIVFQRPAASWAQRYTPDHAIPLAAGLARALDVRPGTQAECTYRRLLRFSAVRQ